MTGNQSAAFDLTRECETQQIIAEVTEMQPNTQQKTSSRTEPVNMRVDSNKKHLIDVAASMLGSDRTSFIIDAAYRRAEEVLMDKRLFLLDDSAFAAFEQALEANPLESNQCLQNLMNRPNRWAK